MEKLLDKANKIIKKEVNMLKLLEKANEIQEKYKKDLRKGVF
jgi:hypothetical protein